MTSQNASNHLYVAELLDQPEVVLCDVLMAPQSVADRQRSVRLTC